MKNNEKNKLDDEYDDEEVEKIFESTWKNWESRRKCEQTHAPEYLKKKSNENRE